MSDANPMRQQCTAQSRWSGPRQCRNLAMRGQGVCFIHGGKSPQALKKAEERLRDLEHPAISALQYLINNGEPAVRLAAARWLLEVLGHKATIQVHGEQQVTIEVVRREQPIQRRALGGNGSSATN